MLLPRPMGAKKSNHVIAPMGSVASEREFKIAKRVTTNRGTLKPGNVEKLLFMKYNLRLMNYKY